MAAIQEGSWVLLTLSSGEKQLARLRRGAVARSGRARIKLDPIIGAPSGGLFLVHDNELIYDERTSEEMDEVVARIAGEGGSGSSNAQLVDDGLAQSLDAAQIKRLKTNGASGEEVLRALATSSKTFAGKTAFSQEKYLKKKAKKHMQWLTASAPTALSIVDMHTAKSPEKVLGLRRDTLSILLSLSNAQPHARVLVLDGMQGLLIGAIAQRLGGDGALLAAN
eukprot:6193579-Pleurochrysis_carterae.AAC.1